MNHLGQTGGLKPSQELLAGIWSRIPSPSSFRFSLGTNYLFLLTPLVHEEIQIEERLQFLKKFHEDFPVLPNTHKTEELRVKLVDLTILTGKNDCKGVIEEILDYNVQYANDRMNKAIQLYSEIITLVAEECGRKLVIEKIGAIPSMELNTWDGVDVETLVGNFKTSKERVFANAKLVDPGWQLIAKSQNSQKSIMKLEPVGQATIEFFILN